MKQSKPMMDELVAKKGKEIDSLLENKNILKAGIYIVSDIKFKEDSIYYFKLLKTIDNKPLPIFNTNPKLIINTNTGENLRIKELTKNYFILEKYKSKNIVLSVGKNQEYTPIELRFDIWIADYYRN
ncbi:MAG: hypothetical protein RAP70_05665 [Candidatus Celaenobacter antarcticus]|nr:hypothetical protein [Candidatus Celaenobacter antarcticus]